MRREHSALHRMTDRGEVQRLAIFSRPVRAGACVPSQGLAAGTALVRGMLRYCGPGPLSIGLSMGASIGLSTGPSTARTP